MDKRTFFYTTATLFAVVGALHLFRALRGWEVVVAGVAIPVWVSWVLGIGVAYLSLVGFGFVKK